MPSSAKASKVFLSLGANIGSPRETLKKAIKELNALGRELKISSLYISKPVGFLNQLDFFNCAVSFTTPLSPHQLLEQIHKIENSLGRVRTFKNAPRTIDIDIILYGSIIIDEQNLKIPHPAALEREFVLKPLADLDANFIFPNSGISIEQALQNLSHKGKESTCVSTGW